MLLGLAMRLVCPWLEFSEYTALPLPFKSKTTLGWVDLAGALSLFCVRWVDAELFVVVKVPFGVGLVVEGCLTGGFDLAGVLALLVLFFFGGCELSGGGLVAAVCA